MNTIDLTPSWAGILPALIAVIRDGTEEGKALAAGELQRMARAADHWNEHAPGLVKTLEFILADGNADLCAETAGLAQDAIAKARGDL